MASNESDPRQLWRIVDDLLGRGRVPASSAIDVEIFSRFFWRESLPVRSRTSEAPPPTFRQGRPDVSLHQFSPLTTNNVIAGIQRLPDKHSAADPIPLPVLKQVGDVVAPFITELFNRSMSEAVFQPRSRRRSSLPL